MATEAKSGGGRKRAAQRKRAARAPVGRSDTAFARRWFRRLGLLGIALGLAPFLLILVYAIPGTKPVSTLMLADALRAQSYERVWTPLDAFPDHLVASVLASEDGQFCRHMGVDWGAVAEVTKDALAGEGVRGASTITMQTVKNLFLPTSKSFVRKAIEVPLASFANLVWGKRRTLEIYLNIAEWAPGSYGAAAGSRFWFGRDVERLTRNQAARLAVTLPNPHVRNPADPGPRVSALARLNQERARGMGPYMDCLRD